MVATFTTIQALIVVLLLFSILVHIEHKGPFGPWVFVLDATSFWNVFALSSSYASAYKFVSDSKE